MIAELRTVLDGDAVRGLSIAPPNFGIERPLSGKRVFIDQLLGVVDESREMLPYKIVLDGSGTLGAHQAVAYAGILGTPVQVGALVEYWGSLLLRYRIGYFKMAEAMSFYGEFQAKHGEWGNQRTEKRDQAVMEFIEAVKSFKLRIVGAGAQMELFTEDKAARNKLVLFRRTLGDLMGYLPSTFNALLVSDMEHDVEHDYRSWINKWKSIDANGKRVVGLCFGDDKHFVEIQAADMVAWLFRQEMERRISGNQGEPSDLYKALIDSKDVGMHLVDPSEFRS